MSDFHNLCREIAEAICDEWSVGEWSYFCDESSFDDVYVETVADFIRDFLESRSLEIRKGFKQMTNEEYVDGCIRTESPCDLGVEARAVGSVRLLHAGIGMATESGEILDQLKKHIFYGKSLDKVNLIEEIGDLFFYIAIACDSLGVSFEEVMQKNNAKLRARYGEKFSSDAAINRDLEKERSILEGNENGAA